MRHARMIVVLGGTLISLAYLLIGLREDFVPARSILSGTCLLFGPPVLVAAALVPTRRGFRIYAVVGAVVIVYMGTWIASSDDFRFPRSILVLAVTYAIAAALPAPDGRLPTWFTPTALVAGAVGVFAVIAPTLAWQERPDSLGVCARTPADANRLADADRPENPYEPWSMAGGIEDISALPGHPNCVKISFEPGVPQRNADRLAAKLRHTPTVISISRT
jgi:hypothetical protein